jgi:molybdate transport system regulatory protein
MVLMASTGDIVREIIMEIDSRQMTAGKLSIRIDLPNGARLGPGKIALLESLHRLRSISAAAREHDMSYRRAWLLVDDLNHAFGEAVVVTFPGRSQGAGAALTPFGEKLVAVYRAAERRCKKAADAAVTEIADACNCDYVADPVTRSPKKAAGRAS